MSSLDAAEIERMRELRRSPEYAEALYEQTYQRILNIYGGQISAHETIEQTQPSMTMMWMLMNEWNPLGRKKEELIAVVGEPSRVEGTDLVYEFTTLYGHSQWRFRMHSNADVVVAVLMD